MQLWPWRQPENDERVTRTDTPDCYRLSIEVSTADQPSGHFSKVQQLSQWRSDTIGKTYMDTKTEKEKENEATEEREDEEEEVKEKEDEKEKAKNEEEKKEEKKKVGETQRLRTEK